MVLSPRRGARPTIRLTAPLTAALAVASLGAACSAPPEAGGQPSFQGGPLPSYGTQDDGSESAADPLAGNGDAQQNADQNAATNGDATGADDPGAQQNGNSPGGESGETSLPLDDNDAAPGSDTGQNAGDGSGQSPDSPDDAQTGQDPGDDQNPPPGDGTQTPPQDPPPQDPPPNDPPPTQQPPSQSDDCPGLFLCDGFEGVSAGSSPSADRWSLVAGYNYGTGPTPIVQVSNQNAFGGNQSLRVEADGLAGVIASVPATRFFVRAWMQVDAAPLGPVLMGIGQDHNSELRFRIQSQSWATINVVPGDAVLPQAAREGNCPTCPQVVPNQWFCVEFFVDDAAQDATLWIDGVEAAVLEAGNGGWPNLGGGPGVRLGTMSLQGGQTGVWIDDVAIGSERLGCN